MRNLIDVFVPGDPKPQPRARSFAFKDKQGNLRVRAYEAGTAEAWKTQLAAALLPLVWDKVNGPVRVRLEFYFTRPPSHFTKRGALTSSAPRFPRARCGDVDNLAKAVLDCLTTLGLWQDDDQVVESTTTKQYHPEKQGCQVIVDALDVDTEVTVESRDTAPVDNQVPLF